MVDMKYIFLSFFLLVLFLGCTDVNERKPEPNENEDFFSVWLNNKTLIYDENDIDLNTLTYSFSESTDVFEVSFNLTKDMSFNCEEGDNYVQMKINNESNGDTFLNENLCNFVSTRSVTLTGITYEKGFKIYSAIAYKE